MYAIFIRMFNGIWNVFAVYYTNWAKKETTLFSNVLNSQLITIENSKNYLGYI